jgi:ketosteroid isomerase-like protein
MSTSNHDFQQFMQQREAAAQSYVEGEAGPLSELSAQELPATFYGPMGGAIQGAKEVLAKYEQDAHAFGPGSQTHFEILHSGASDSVAYWTGFQYAKAVMKGEREPVPMKLRVTEVFRREDRGWKLVHRHADPLAEPKAKG